MKMEKIRVTMGEFLADTMRRGSLNAKRRLLLECASIFSRAVLMALLLPDPCDEHCPAEFKQQARGLLAGREDLGHVKLAQRMADDFTEIEAASTMSAIGHISAAALPDQPSLVA